MKKRCFYFLLIFPLLIFSQGSGNSLSFNGTSQIVTVPILSANIGNTDFTVECFAKFNSFADYGGVVTTFDTNLGGGWAIHQQLDGSVTFLIGTDASANFDQISSLGSLSTGVWYHIVSVKRGANLELYINGELQGSVTSNRIIPFKPMHIGTRYINYSTWRHNGGLDELRIWNTALTQTEIRSNLTKKITSAHPNYANLVAYYNFDAGSGTSLVDQTANGNNGTLINSPTWQTSSAPIGNDNAFLTTVSTGSSLNLAHSNGSDLTVNVTSGTAAALYIYNITEQPNVTTPPLGLDQLSESNYFGVKAFGSASLVYEVVYNYNGHIGIGDENNLRLSSRADNATTSWTAQAATLNTVANTLTLGGQTGTEFILGSVGGNTLPVAAFELEDFSIYPNPTTEILKLPKSKNSENRYQIFDVTGKQVLEGFSINNTINVSLLKQGLYFLKLENTILYKFLKK